MCVRTNVGYSVVAGPIQELESTKSISEALHILHSWNPEWNRKFWMCDYSDVEMNAVFHTQSFTSVTSIMNRYCKGGSKMGNMA